MGSGVLRMPLQSTSTMSQTHQYRFIVLSVGYTYTVLENRQRLYMVIKLYEHTLNVKRQGLDQPSYDQTYYIVIPKVVIL